MKVLSSFCLYSILWWCLENHYVPRKVHVIVYNIFQDGHVVNSPKVSAAKAVQKQVSMPYSYVCIEDKL